MNKTAIKALEMADIWLNLHKNEIIQEIQDIARIPSVSDAKSGTPGAPFGKGCRNALDHALARGKDYGFQTKDLDGYAGIISMGNEEKTIGIFSHLDVVPAGEGWVYPPYDATWLPEHNVLVGRGVDDNKGSMVMALFVMRMLRDFNVPMKHGVSLFCGTSEETGMEDMAALKAKGFTFPKLSLVPDAGFPVNYGQKGSLTGKISAVTDGNLVSFEAGSVRNIVPDTASCVLNAEQPAARAALKKLEPQLQERILMEKLPQGIRLTASGVSGHAAHPENCINAIHILASALDQSGLLTGSCRNMIHFLSGLTSDPFGISEGVAFEDEISGPLTLVYSIANLHEGHLEVSMDCRYPITCPSETLKQTLVSLWEMNGFSPDNLKIEPPFYMPKDSPIVTALQDIYHQITGRNEQPYTMGGGTYSRIVPNAISFGPGMPGNRSRADFLPEGHGGAHGRDEILPLDKFMNCARIYLAALITLDELLD